MSRLLFIDQVFETWIGDLVIWFRVSALLQVKDIVVVNRGLTLRMQFLMESGEQVERCWEHVLVTECWCLGVECVSSHWSVTDHR